MKPEAVEKERFEKITAIVENEMEALSKEIVKKLLGKIQSYTKVIFVHGGGSIPLKKKLKPALEAVGERFAGIPIVYISSEDARFLNSRGMFLLAVMIFSESETGTKNK